MSDQWIKCVNYFNKLNCEPESDKLISKNIFFVFKIGILKRKFVNLCFPSISNYQKFIVKFIKLNKNGALFLSDSRCWEKWFDLYQMNILSIIFWVKKKPRHSETEEIIQDEKIFASNLFDGM